jgi:hypothetical protein
MRKFLLCLLPLLILLAGCEKEAGEGGRAEIVGRVMAQNHNTEGLPIFDPYPMPEHRVYIIYGDGAFHDDDVRTSADGRFRFTRLRKGSYTVYTISQKPRTSADASGTYTVSKRVEITDRKEVLDIGDLAIQRYRGWQ